MADKKKQTGFNFETVASIVVMLVGAVVEACYCSAVSRCFESGGSGIPRETKNASHEKEFSTRLI